MNDWLDAEGHADRAFEMYERGKWAEAESELRKALSLNPDQAEWHFNLGLTLEAAGRDQEAFNSYVRATELLPDQADPRIAAGVVANRLGLWNETIRLLESALRFDPKNEVAYCNKIEAHFRLGDHDEAEATFYLAQHALEDTSPHCLAIIAESLMQRQQYARAAWCLKEALRIEPNLPRVAARLGSIYAALGKPQRALQFFLRDLRDDPGNIDTLLDFGELLIDLGRMPEAAEKFRRVLELEPANVDAHMRLGQIAMRTMRYEQAHLEFELVLKLDPQFPHVRLSLAEALIRRGRVLDAQACLRDEFDAMQAGDSYDSDDDASPIWSTHELDRFGALLMDAALPSLAVRVLDEALKDDTLTTPQRVDLLRRLALALFEKGDREAGIRCSRRVLRLAPKCIASIHNLALASLQDGRLECATTWIQRGMSVDRHDDGIRRLRVRLWMAKAKLTLLRFLGARR